MQKSYSRWMVFFLILLFCCNIPVKAQKSYIEGQRLITEMLNGRDSLDLRKAVYCVENAWYDGNLNRDTFEKVIVEYADFCRGIMASGDIVYEGKGDEQAAKTQCAAFVFMTDSIPVKYGESIVWNPPFGYNFDDYAGERDWSNMFVTKLMQTRKGNCHSLPLLYKLIMDELGEPVWLSLLPNHMYIKARNDRAGWYNIELTCGDFPTDAWLMASGYVHLDAVRNGVYLDTLSLRESVAMCLTDLAQGYERKYGTREDGFVEECCDTVLRYFPDYMNARLIKADLIARRYRKYGTDELKREMNEQYSLIHSQGYRKMPESMYLNWIHSLDEQSEEYRSRKVVVDHKKETGRDS